MRRAGASPGNGHGNGRRGGIWERIARLVTDHPVAVMAVALAILVPPLLALPGMRLSHDTLDDLPGSSPSVEGFEVLSEHFPPGELSPVILVIDDDEPVTQPASLRALGDLSRNLKRLDVVATVRSVAMPTNGAVPPVEGTDALERIGDFADRLQQAADGARRIEDGGGRLTEGLAEIAARLPDLRSGLTDAGEGASQLLAGVRELRAGAGDLHSGLVELRDGLTEARDGARRLRTDVAIPAEQRVRDAWDHFEAFTVGRSDPQYDDLGEDLGHVHGLLTGEHPVTGDPVEPGYDGLAAALAELQDGLDEAAAGAAALADGARQVVEGLAQVEDGLQRLAAGLEAARPGVSELQDGIGRLLDGARQLEAGAGRLREGLASGVAQLRDADLETLLPVGGGEADGPFVITPALLEAMPGVEEQLELFLAEEGTRTRVFIGLSRSPFAPEAMSGIDRIVEVAELSLSDSPLEDARVLPTGLTSFFHDLDAAADRDFGVLLVAVLVSVFLVLALLLRALVAPIYLVATVLLSFATALGLATITFQWLLGGGGLAWWIPPFLFVLLVALGADYNIYLMSRVREEADRASTRGAIAEATRLTGGVITSAGLILAGTFAAMMSADMSSLVQMGFATTVGILLDTFVVRTFLVPAIATLLGRHNWWPSARASAEAEAAAGQ